MSDNWRVERIAETFYFTQEGEMLVKEAPEFSDEQMAQLAGAIEVIYRIFQDQPINIEQPQTDTLEQTDLEKSTDAGNSETGAERSDKSSNSKENDDDSTKKEEKPPTKSDKPKTTRRKRSSTRKKSES